MLTNLTAYSIFIAFGKENREGDLKTMIELISKEQLARAIENAKAANLYVRPSSMFRQYVVENRGNGKIYTVDFFVRNRRRFGHCTCAAGEHSMACKHLAASAGYHLMRAEQMRSH
jgi:hypothetical protein